MEFWLVVAIAGAVDIAFGEVFDQMVKSTPKMRKFGLREVSNIYIYIFE